MDTLVAGVLLRTHFKRILALDVLLEVTWKSSDITNSAGVKNQRLGGTNQDHLLTWKLLVIRVTAWQLMYISALCISVWSAYSLSCRYWSHLICLSAPLKLSNRNYFLALREASVIVWFIIRSNSGNFLRSQAYVNTVCTCWPCQTSNIFITVQIVRISGFVRLDLGSFVF